MTSYFVSAHGSHYAQIWLKGVDIKKKVHLYFILFVYAFLVHSMVGHIPNIDCDLFMSMGHSCNDISDLE